MAGPIILELHGETYYPATREQWVAFKVIGKRIPVTPESVGTR